MMTDPTIYAVFVDATEYAGSRMVAWYPNEVDATAHCAALNAAIVEAGPEPIPPHRWLEGAEKVAYERERDEWTDRWRIVVVALDDDEDAIAGRWAEAPRYAVVPIRRGMFPFVRAPRTIKDAQP